MSNGTLLINIAGPNCGQFSILDVLGNATISPDGLLDPVLQNGFIPTVGEEFIFMEYGSLLGSFFIQHLLPITTNFVKCPEIKECSLVGAEKKPGDSKFVICNPQKLFRERTHFKDKRCFE
jgi:hypothetical protein